MALPLEAGEAVGAAVEEGGAESGHVAAVGPEGGEAGVFEARGDGGAFAVAEEDLDLAEGEGGGVESLELGGRVGVSRFEGCHGCGPEGGRKGRSMEVQDESDAADGLYEAEAYCSRS